MIIWERDTFIRSKLLRLRVIQIRTLGPGIWYQNATRMVSTPSPAYTLSGPKSIEYIWSNGDPDKDQRPDLPLEQIVVVKQPLPGVIH